MITIPAIAPGSKPESSCVFLGGGETKQTNATHLPICCNYPDYENKREYENEFIKYFMNFIRLLLMTDCF